MCSDNITGRSVGELLENASFKTKTLNCHGCENNCLVIKYDFGGSKVYYSGNRCEKIFNNGGKALKKGLDAYEKKFKLLFDRTGGVVNGGSERIGIPRVLNMYEDFPFWHTLFTECGFEVVLSDLSNMKEYEENARMVMSDNICFPAKLVHAHISNLAAKGVERIFFPFVVHGPKGKDQNSYNCPVVAGYSQVIKGSGNSNIKIDDPTISMKDGTLFKKQCRDYLKSLGVNGRKAGKAFRKASETMLSFEKEICEYNKSILERKVPGTLTIMLAGRPYHTDPLIQHQVSEMIAGMGIDVITDDIVRDMEISLEDVNFLSQWTYTNRILRAAKWCSLQGPEIQFVELTSFGCGPDAFLIDALRDLLMRHGKSLTILKLDDINNVGSMKLRIRSLVDSLKLAGEKASVKHEEKAFVTTPPFLKEDRKKTIIAPYFTPFLSPLIPSVMKKTGLNVVCLPMSDQNSANLGLKYANNEVCYPATLIVGDIIKALSKGNYTTSDTAVAMTQTGGQCRASNYLSLIKKAMSDAGYGNVPVISVSFESGISNYQPGFKVNWTKVLPVALYTILFGDCLAKLYYPALVRQKPGTDAKALKDSFMQRAAVLIDNDQYKLLLPLISEAAGAFNAISDDSVHKRVGIVGEIFLKFNPFAHRNLINWLSERGVEVIPPILCDFFIQYFVNRKTNSAKKIEKNWIPSAIMDGLYSMLEKRIKEFEKACSGFRYFRPFEDIFDEARLASDAISHSSQFGEGWLLPGEIGALYKSGVHNVLSLQPFGCIANHIVVRGIEKKIKKLYSDINMLAIDFDFGVSEVNIINRLLLFTDNLR
jgi:predicted nucleotide-binding protein (sugar kinase/HSP70/actin superfamily)